MFGDFRDGTSHTILFSEKILGDGIPTRFTPWSDYFYVRQRDIVTADDAVSACGSLSSANPAHDSYVGWTWLFGGWNATWYNHILPPNSPVPDCGAGGEGVAGGGPGAYTARSFHSGGVNASFADGSARFISSTIDLSVWRAVSTRAGDDPIGDF
jgi:prepilin-type processing-associated H-X9-DG protein